MNDVLSTIEQHAPDSIAVEMADGAWTYEDLLAWSARIARGLTEWGVGEEHLVGILLDHPPSLPAAVLATWRCGAAFLPLSRMDPEARLHAILADSGARVVITERHLAVRVPRSVRALALEDLNSVDPLPSRCPSVPPTRLAYAIYTSGSTGTPKAALIEHRGLGELVHWMRHGPLAVSPADRVLQWATSTVDAFVWELLVALGCGGTLVFPQPGADLIDLDALLARAHMTIATLTPTVWRHLPDSSVAGLRIAISAGEACPEDIATRLSRHSLFVNAYGPTEATICASAAIGPYAHASIGEPVGHATLAVSDDTDGEGVGELRIGGAGVARGYLGRPRQTAEVFIPDPASSTPGARIYCSGDRVRRGKDGRLRFLGRIDDQVKVRGFRVELGEVEQALETHQRVMAAAAATRETNNIADLVAFVTINQGPEVPPEFLRAHLRSLLPDHMVPSRLHVISRMPLTAWGKIDRNALEEPAYVAEPSDGASALEREILSIWRRVLSNAHIGVNQDFFDVGGNSLLAMRIVGELRRSHAPALTIRDLFERPTVARLSAYLETEQ
jgi:amino acid adenylation domain-containing protein